MGEHNFNQRQCIHALRAIGFREETVHHGRHMKFHAPAHVKSLYADQPAFIMVPRHKDLHAQHAIVRELRRIGGDDLVDKFLTNL